MTVIGAGARVLVLALAAAIVIPVQALALRFGLPPAEWLPVYFHRLFLGLFRVRVIEQGTPPSGPTLILSNHVSWSDIPVIGSLRPLSFIAKAEVAGWPVIGLFARLQRCIFIDRARKSHTRQVNQEVARRLAGGDLIVLFPEGTTSDGNRLLPFRSALVGAARAALAEPGLQRIDLQPLAIAYVRRNGLPVTRRERPALAWYGDMELAPQLAAFLRESSLDVIVRWGAPIPFDATSHRKAATTAAEAAVRRALQEVLRNGLDAIKAERGLFSPASRAPKESAIRQSRSPESISPP